MRDDNTWLYIQGNYQILFVFAKNWLRRYYVVKAPEVSDKFGTVRTFYLPLTIATEHAARVIDAAAEVGRKRT